VLVFANNASASLSASRIAADTTLFVTSGQGAAFPACSAADGTAFYATLTSDGLPGTREIVLITDHAAYTDTMTAVRGQDGTTALDWASGSTIECRVTAGMLASFGQAWTAEVGASALYGYCAVAVGSDGLLVPADCTIAAHMGAVVGVVVDYTAAGDDATVQTGRVINYASWSWTPGPVFVGTGGALTQTVDSGALFVQVVGHAVSATAMIVGVQAPILRSGMPVSPSPLSIALPAAGALSAGDWVNIFDNSSVISARQADATATGYEAHGFVLAAVAGTDTATVYLMGVNTSVSGQTPGTVYLQTTPGTGGGTAPATTGNVVQRIGVAVSASAVVFTPGDAVVV